jgi:Domain of unknown function (DUF5925)/ATPase family associated with various cellular activities (AAA)
MSTTFDDITESEAIGIADPIVAPRTVFDGGDSAFAVVRSAYRAAQLDGHEPHVVELDFGAKVDVESLLPADAELLRSVVDDDGDTILFARGIGYSVLACTIGRVSVSVSAPSRERARAVAEEIQGRAPAPTPSDTTPLRTWYTGSHGPTSQVRSIAAPTWDSIEHNYPAATRAALGELHRLVRPRGSGKLVLWHGPPGTGKTTALRSLLRSWTPWCDAHYVADPEALFDRPEYILRVLTQSVAPTSVALANDGRDARDRGPRFRLVVAEDSDEFLRASARRDAGASLGRLLNVTDGVLGQGFDVVVLLTTNEEIGRLHPALVRPGRCLAAVQFTEFAPDEAATWLGPAVRAPATPATLAELFEQRGDVGRVFAESGDDRAPGQYL